MRIRILSDDTAHPRNHVVAVETPEGDRLIRDGQAVAVTDHSGLTFGLTTAQVDHLTRVALDRADTDVLRARLALEGAVATQRAVAAECRRLREAVGL